MEPPPYDDSQQSRPSAPPPPPPANPDFQPQIGASQQQPQQPAAPQIVIVNTGGAGPPPGPAPLPAVQGPDITLKLQELDIPYEMYKDLIECAGTDIVVIADDSGSMRNYAQPGLTRWQELQQTLTRLIDILLAVDHTDGFHITFLSQIKFFNIRSPEQVHQLFQTHGPRGGTPLQAALQASFSGMWNPKPYPPQDVILLVMTDGEPSDCTLDMMARLIQGRPQNYFCSFLMCTGEDDIVEKYNRVIDPIWGCDISDDYESERKEVRRATGKDLSRNQWLTKCVLGGKFVKYDRMDEGRTGGGDKCCTVQ